jgi:LCP family protein required for cell wall assembly
MSPQGEERPPGRPEEPERPEGPEKPERSEPPEKPERPEEPEYTVYGKGGSSGERREAPKREGKGEKGEKPTYRVYRSRPSLLDRFRKPGLTGLRGASGGGVRERLSRLGGGGRRRWLRWVLIAIAAWIVISFVTFGISAQIQKGKLDDNAKEALAGGPDLLAGQNILILGGDRRGSTQRNAAGSEGQGPPRADSIIVLHASLTSFRKLSIPRDTYAAIPDCGTQKINASLACNTNSPKGNAASTIRTVEDFLGIDINHIIIVDFDGFADFIDTLGGVTIDVPRRGRGKGPVVCGDVDGGKSQGGVSLKLTAGDHTLEGDKALAYARLRHNPCDPSEDDTDRAARQQAVLNGVKGRLTSITRLPINFIKGPFIGWDAPRAFISDMGGFTLPQLAITAIFGGSGKTNVLEPSGVGPGASLLISQGECNDAVEELTGGAPKREPACSPG